MARRVSARDVFWQVGESYGRDRSLCVSFAVALSGVSVYAAHQTRKKEIQLYFELMRDVLFGDNKKARHARATKGATNIGGGGERSETSSGIRALSSGKPPSGMEASEKSLAATKVKTNKSSSKAAAVDQTFLRRLKFLMRIVVPSWHSEEAFLLFVQSMALVSRSYISLRMAETGGAGLRAVMERDWLSGAVVLTDFFISGVAAAAVNSALKYMTNSITTCFRERLTLHVHDAYLSHRAYYKAAVLRYGDLDNADQRVAEDLNQFCYTISDLYARTFKPLLDVVLSTSRMSQTMGYSGLLTLYVYFGLSGAIVRAFSPPFGEYIAQTQKREGDFRRTHSRLIQHAEEVAFLDGSAREKAILNGALRELTTWSHFYYYLQFKQGIIDQYALKYFASMIGWPVLAVPFMLSNRDLSASEIAARYKENDTLIKSASGSIGDLMLVYKKLQRLAGFTARVTELIESVDSIQVEPSNVEVAAEGDDGIHFENVTVHAPDGRLLVQDLTLSVNPGESVFITGANGAGKTSIFRVLAGLWRATSGKVIRPSHGLATTDDGDAAIFYVPQRPYLVSGTLRDQVMYPLPGDSSRDDEIIECLQLANLLKIVDASVRGLDRSEHDWADVLSGGEKQRIGLARLYFHKPTFAILDEATSAINPDEEGLLYAHIDTLGITAFSIAHRMELKRFHSLHLHLAADGSGKWSLKNLKRASWNVGEGMTSLRRSFELNTRALNNA
jgi:ATP-binding cassette, subfamily D (ALD), member 3